MVGGALSSRKVQRELGKHSVIIGQIFRFTMLIYFWESIFSLPGANVPTPTYVIHPQNMTLAGLKEEGLTRTSRHVGSKALSSLRQTGLGFVTKSNSH